MRPLLPSNLLLGVLLIPLHLLLSTATVTKAASLSFSPPKPHPLVIWHGLGDSAHSEAMSSFIGQLQEAFPGLYVHSVSMSPTGDDSEDRKAGFFGKASEDVEFACKQIAEVDELKNGFDAIGFSQGGQFLRAYVEKCNLPKVRNLVTFGSQHMGISDFPACTPTDFLCRIAESALRGGVYTDYAQSHLISAQYFRNPRDPNGFAKYLEKNDFIKDINNEVEINKTYAENLLSLDNFVMIMFDKDITVEPKQSSWFASYPIANETDSIGQAKPSPTNEVVPLRQSSIYLEDRIGLKKLDERGSLVMELCHGIHMQIDGACQMKVFGKFIGTPISPHFVPRGLRVWLARLLYGVLGLRIQDVGDEVLAQLFLVLLIVSGLKLLVGMGRNKW
ncbi:alpha/beta-hydrolase [Violaceomyces palustris]|uniref:Alpha/beta-hydrolase n=1 Tax=Violaceomyces palustris TaxID=1673888 RepID=A0ACD0NTS7_9BASI|nr:alpha/beta-hydrolase [Violaceomyces palustris]